MLKFHSRRTRRRSQNASAAAASFFMISLAVASLSCYSASAAAQAKSAPSGFETLSKQAAEARDADRLDEAVRLYKQALALQPKWAEGWFSLGTIEYDRNHFAPAALAFRRMLPLAPSNGTARILLGLCEFELGQDSAALKHITEGKNLNVTNSPELRLVALYHEGTLLLRIGRFKSAEESFSALCKDILPPSEALRYFGEAVLRISPAAAPAPQSPGDAILLRVGRAACVAGQKKFDEARREYEAIVAAQPDYPGVHYAFGKFLLEVNDVSDAIEQFKTELRNNPGDVNSRLEIAAAQYKLDSAAGLPYAEEAVQLNPRIPFAHYLLGLLYLDTDNYQKAIPQLEIAQKSFPKDAKVYFALGSAYSRAGRRQDAERARATFQRLSQGTAEESKASY